MLAELATDMPSSSLARVVQRPAFSWVTPYGKASVNYSGGNRGAGLRRRIADETGDRTREFQSARDEVIANPNTQPDNASANRLATNPATSAATSSAPITPTAPVGNAGVVNGQVSGGAPVNPTTGLPSAMQAAQDAHDLFMARGGSEATLHRAEVAQGRRPAIDARTVHSAAEAPSDASAAAMQQFGDGGPGQEGHSPWPGSGMGSAGSAIWAQMSQKFNDSRAKLRASLNPPPTSTANVIPTPDPGTTYQWPAGQFPGIPDAAPLANDSLASVTPAPDSSPSEEN